MPENKKRIDADRADVKRREEVKRDAAYDPVLRWKHIQEMIAWVEANLSPQRRRNRPRTRPSQTLSR